MNSAAFHCFLRAGTTLATLLASASLSHAQQDITSNLRGHWRLTETSGTTAVDSSAVPHSGAYTNGPVLASSTPNPIDSAVAAKFDGVNDYVSISTESYFDITGNITVACWIKVDVWDVAYQAIVTKGDSAWRLSRDASNNGVAFACSGLSTIQVISNVPVNDGKWHHIVGQYNSGYLMIYVDGVLSNWVSVWGSISTNNYPVEIGRNPEAPGREFDGAIYDVRVYNRGLSPQDIAYLALQGGPVGAWSLNQSSGTTVTDSSYYADHGTVTGTASWTTRCNGTGAFNFNGSTYVSVPNATQLQPVFGLSLMGWIRGDAWTSGDTVNTIIRKGEGTPNNYALSVADGKAQLLLDASDSAGIRGNTTLATGQWYHIAATWDGATARVYVNGVLDASPVAYSAFLGQDTRALYLGGRSGATDMFDGLLQDLRVYNRALSPTEVAQAAGLPGHWKFAEGTGATAADSTIAANNATLSGGATWTTDCAGNKALLTDGAGGIAQTAAAFEPPAEGTIAFWMAPSASTAVRRVFGLGGNWEVRQLADHTLVFDICADGGTNTVSTTTPLDEAGRWYHVAFTYDCDDNSFAIYLDGELHRTGISSNDMVKQAAAVLAFGTRSGATEYWPGALRDFRVYSRKLCATEVGDLAGVALHWKLDETSGAVAADSTPAGRNGTVTGTATWTAGKDGNALLLNGATYVSASMSGLSPRNVTIAAWANLTAADTGGAELISLGDCFAIRLNDGGNSRAFFYNGLTWQSVTVNQTFAGAGWRHFAAVFDDDNNIVRFYINGSEAATLATTSSISYSGVGSNIVVGRHGNGGSSFDFTGLIDDARVYSRALCASQIAEIVADGGGLYQGVRILKWVEVR